MSTPATRVAATAPTTDWIRNPVFDATFLWGTALLGLTGGLIVLAQPSLFMVVLMLDVWLLGYHHVISTFTRIGMDRASVSENRFFLFGLPVIVAAGTAAMWSVFGVAAVTTLYFYWQAFHYTRQSYGIERMTARKAGAHATPDPLVRFLIYGLPAYGILYRSWQAQPTFLSYDVFWIPVPTALAITGGVVTGAAVLAWCVRTARQASRGENRNAHTAYLASHIFLFSVGYLLIEDVSAGWLVINIWHNAQYILTVWLFNTNRFKHGIDPQATFLSTISQPENFARYMLVSMAITTLVYAAVYLAAASLAGVFERGTLLLFMVLNFHHYVVDGYIWKMRKPKVRDTLVGASA